MVQPKRYLPKEDQDNEWERPKRQNSGDQLLARPRSRRLSSEESEYTTDEASDEEEEYAPGLGSGSGSTLAPGRKKSSSKASLVPSRLPNQKAPRRWQPSEDRRLAECVKQHGEANWKAIAAGVGSRNHVQCLQRWKKVLRPGLVKGQWSAQEDAVLMKLACSGYKNWGVLSNHMPGRTSKQCRERWYHHLDPSINKSAYTPREDKIIIETQARLGNKWSQIAGRLPGRTENSIKIRCKALQRRGTGAQSSCNSGSTRGSSSKKGSAATVSRPRTTAAAAATATADTTNEEPKPKVVDMPSPNVCSASSISCPPPIDKLEFNTKWPPSSSRSPVESTGRPMPFSPPRSPFFQHNTGGGTSSSATPVSFASVAGPVRAPAPAPGFTSVGDDGNLDGLWKQWSKTVAPGVRHAGNTVPRLAAPCFSSSSAAAPSVVKNEVSNRATFARSFDDYSAMASFARQAPPPSMELSAVKSEPAERAPFCEGFGAYPATLALDADNTALSETGTGFPRASCAGMPDPPLSQLFAFGLSAIMENTGENTEREQQRCSVEPSSVGAALSATGEELVAPSATVEPNIAAIGKAQNEDAQDELGDLNPLDVNNLEGKEGEDEAAAPLRSCCSFLDLPGEGMVLGDMPLSW